jgi:hypothetical protein
MKNLGNVRIDMVFTACYKGYSYYINDCELGWIT